jgi:hypothetical protein
MIGGQAAVMVMHVFSASSIHLVNGGLRRELWLREIESLVLVTGSCLCKPGCTSEDAGVRFRVATLPSTNGCCGNIPARLIG